MSKIILEDCVEGLKKLPDSSADIILLDPPYNIGKNFGNNSTKSDIEEYCNWADQWLQQSVRVLKKSGTLYLYGFSEILAHLSARLELDNRWLIWHYTNKAVASNPFWQRSHESIVCAWKNKDRTFNRDAVRIPYTDTFLKGAAGKERASTSGRFGSTETTYTAHPNGALPRDVITVPALAGGAGLKERVLYCKDCDYVGLDKKIHKDHNIIQHPTQKPIKLTEKLLKAAKPESGGTVVIPFAGSGIECYVAKQLGMEYIAYDINPDFIELASRFNLEK